MLNDPGLKNRLGTPMDESHPRMTLVLNAEPHMRSLINEMHY